MRALYNMWSEQQLKTRPIKYKFSQETNQQTPAQQDTVLINQHQQFTQAWWVKAKLIHKRPVMWAVGLDMPGL